MLRERKGAPCRALVRRAAGVCLEMHDSAPLAAGHVRVAIGVVGICRTDTYAADGSLDVARGRILGHEGMGRVLETCHGGPTMGARVTVVPVIACGRCPACVGGGRCGRPELLGIDRDGLFADEVALPPEALLEVPDALDDRRAAFVEPVAAALAVEHAGLALDRPGVVVGRGRIGTLVVRVLASLGGRDVVLRAPEDPFEHDVWAWAVETVPTERALEWAMHAVVVDGVVVLKSRPALPTAIDAGVVVRKRLALRGVDWAPFGRAIAWLAEHDVDDLFEEPWPVERFERAFEHARRDESKKVFLRFGD